MPVKGAAWLVPMVNLVSEGFWGAGMKVRSTVAVLALAIASAAHADDVTTTRAWKNCEGGEGVWAEMRISGCSEVIKGGQAEGETLPAEELVNLHLRLNQPQEALAVAREYLADVTDRPLTCPNLVELCRRAGDYSVLADSARAKGDAVHYLAGRLAGCR